MRARAAGWSWFGAQGHVPPLPWVPRDLRSLVVAAALACSGMMSNAAVAQTDKIAPAIAARVQADAVAEAIVEFDARDVDALFTSERARSGLRFDTAAMTARRAEAYRRLKARALAALRGDDLEVVADYSHLPMAFMRIRSAAALARLAAHPDVRAVHRNDVLRTTLAEGSPLVGQPAATAAGWGGAGATVLVIDTGVLYNRTEFGSCPVVGAAGCKVAFFGRANLVGCGPFGCSYQVAPLAVPFDASGHGTNVSAIVIGVAPESRLAVIDVFENGTTTDSSRVIAAINWGIANATAYNIVALNLSLGNVGQYSQECGSTSNPAGNPFVTPVDLARSKGILPIASAGNSGFTNAISSPACTAGVVSVGAVYDSAFGTINWSLPCSDATHADRVACFSNSAPILDLLAPGALINAGGNSRGGTSQATPFVAGAAAVLRARYSGDTLDQTLARMTSSGIPVTDPRNGLVKPRLSLGGALGISFAGNDPFAQRFTLTGTAGAATGTNAAATKQSGEPAHAGNSGGKSVWWRWVAPVTGQVALDTQGSTFDTLLAVYTGSSVSALLAVAANDDAGPGGTSALLFQAQAGTEYQIAVDGRNGASGSIALSWATNETAAADLAVSLTATPATVPLSGQVAYAATVRNNGPQGAVNVRLVDALPGAVEYVSASPGCTTSAGTVTCSLGTLASGAEVRVEIVATARQLGAVVNSVVGSSATPDGVTANNSAAASVTVVSGVQVPTQPHWATVLGVLALAAIGFQATRRGSSGWPGTRRR